MAELIPIEYRIQVARGQHLQRWAFVVILTAVMAGGGLAYAFAWERGRASEFERLNSEYHAKSVLITQARELQSRRLDLAARMKKMQELMNDKVLISLLRSVSNGFSTNDLLTYLSIDAHPRQAAGAKPAEDFGYRVHVNGITASDASHAALVGRLADIGARSDPPIAINPESLRREKMFDGQVMRFQIVCVKPGSSGS
jgi:hypothetical protein